jgi:hypothetical protein
MHAGQLVVGLVLTRQGQHAKEVLLERASFPLVLRDHPILTFQKGFLALAKTSCRKFSEIISGTTKTQFEKNGREGILYQAREAVKARLVVPMAMVSEADSSYTNG